MGVVPAIIIRTFNREGEEEFAIAFSFEDAMSGPAFAERAVETQREYARLVENCRRMLPKAESVIEKWRTGKMIVDFIKFVERNGIYIINFTSALLRDLAV